MTKKMANPLELLERALGRWKGRKNVKTFHFREISMLETSQIVGKLGNSISFGHDKIDAMMLKLILPSILIPLRHLINMSLTQRKFVIKWKISKVVPLLKDRNSNKLDPNEYRPVSLLSTTLKLIKRAAQTQLLQFFEDSGQLNSGGHAYRHFLSTTTTIAQICDQLYQAAEERKISSVMTLDQSAAFDCISHQLLLDKLKLYQVETDALEWIGNYLKYRSQ